MNLSSLSDTDLRILMDAVLNTEDNPAADAVAGAVIQEQAVRQGAEHAVQVGWQIEVLEDGKWKTLDRSDVAAGVHSRFYSEILVAQKAMRRINEKIQERRFEYRTRQYKRGEYRFVQVTTIRKVA